MRTKLLKINPGRPERKRILIAAEVIKRGGLVVFPTETVYGIGADALNEKAVKKIYKVKGRPSDNPLMIHVSDMEMASRLGVFPERYRKIVRKLWPGPISFVVKARDLRGRKELAIRMPDNKVALALIKASGTPIAAPSANISKKPSSTTAAHAMKYFDGKVDIVLDAGPAKNGIESTILDLRTFALLRPGAFSAEKITSAFGRRPKITVIARGTRTAPTAISPGMKYRHYSPDTPLFLFTGKIDKLHEITNGIKQRFAFIGSDGSCKIMNGCAESVIRLGKASRKEEIAHNLFSALIALDSKGLDFAIIEGFEEEGVGLAIMNRIRKACSNKYFSDAKGLRMLLRLDGLGA
ncbi:MAG: threonylcarbamoyl-AMP synthase [Candidatus Micrarchaeota archaeon]|nr:threonylcarbamoyl-AMP synthase [Candidatus Micrarchaeota archaeon]